MAEATFQLTCLAVPDNPLPRSVPAGCSNTAQPMESHPSMEGAPCPQAEMLSAWNLDAERPGEQEPRVQPLPNLPQGRRPSRAHVPEGAVHRHRGARRNLVRKVYKQICPHPGRYKHLSSWGQSFRVLTSERATPLRYLRQRGLRFQIPCCLRRHSLVRGRRGLERGNRNPVLAQGHGTPGWKGQRRSRVLHVTDVNAGSGR